MLSTEKAFNVNKPPWSSCNRVSENTSYIVNENVLSCVWNCELIIKQLTAFCRNKNTDLVVYKTNFVRVHKDLMQKV